MIKIKMNMSGALARLDAIGKQARFATARALNAAAYKAARDTKKEIGRVFDRPTPWVLNSVRYTKATKSKLEATIDFDFWGNKQGVTVAHVLRSSIIGGQRRLKRHEVALQRAGILPAGHAIVPGSGAKFDQHGNMSAGQIVQIMSWFKAFGEQGYSANMRDRGRRLARGNKKTGVRGFAYFLLRKRHGKLSPGIYQRTSFGSLGSSVKPVMIFVPMPKYRRRLDFYGVAERSARKEFAAQFPRMFAEAMRTAK